MLHVRWACVHMARCCWGSGLALRAWVCGCCCKAGSSPRSPPARAVPLRTLTSPCCAHPLIAATAATYCSSSRRMLRCLRAKRMTTSLLCRWWAQWPRCSASRSSSRSARVCARALRLGTCIGGGRAHSGRALCVRGTRLHPVQHLGGWHPTPRPLSGVPLCAEFLTGAIEEVSKTSGINEAFLGLIVLPIAGNAAEHITGEAAQGWVDCEVLLPRQHGAAPAGRWPVARAAHAWLFIVSCTHHAHTPRWLAAVFVAVKDKMDLAIGVALGSSIQIAIFVIPVVVVAGWVLGKPFTLDFDAFSVLMLTGAPRVRMHPRLLGVPCPCPCQRAAAAAANPLVACARAFVAACVHVHRGRQPPSCSIALRVHLPTRVRACARPLTRSRARSVRHPRLLCLL